MNTRRITLILGTAAGGLAAAAFLPMAGASADTYDITPAGPETYSGINGDPPYFQDLQGQEILNVTDTTTNTSTGNFTVDLANFASPFGYSNQEELVVGEDLANGAAGTVAGAPGGVGSVFDTTTFGPSSFEFVNQYSDVVTGSGASATSTVTDELLTPFSSTPIDLTPYVDALGLNPADMVGFPYISFDLAFTGLPA